MRITHVYSHVLANYGLRNNSAYEMYIGTRMRNEDAGTRWVAIKGNDSLVNALVSQIFEPEQYTEKKGGGHQRSPVFRIGWNPPCLSNDAYKPFDNYGPKASLKHNEHPI